MRIFTTLRFWIVAMVMTITIWPSMQSAWAQVDPVGMATNNSYAPVLETAVSSLGPSIVVAWAILKQAWAREMRMSDRITVLEDRFQSNLEENRNIVKELNVIVANLHMAVGKRSKGVVDEN